MNVDIKALRTRLSLSQAGLARKLGVNQAMISRLEKGKRPLKGPVAVLIERMDREAPKVGETEQ